MSYAGDDAQRPPSCRAFLLDAVSSDLLLNTSLLLLVLNVCHGTTTTIQLFNGLFSRTTWVSRYQKGKTNLDFTGARDSEWQWHQLGHMQVCTSVQTDNHASNPPLVFLQAGCPSCRPTNSVKALKAWCTKLKYLGCIFLDGSCEIDISPSVEKFYAQFNNIMAVLGKYNNEMAAVHLTNSYCVPSLLYACEIWSLSNSSAHSVPVAVNDLFRRIFNCC